MEQNSKPDLKAYILRQYIANFLLIVGLFLLFAGLDFGLIPFLAGISYRLYQKFFQRELHSQDKALKKSILTAKREKKESESSTAKELRKMRFALVSMSVAMALFILGFTLLFVIP